MPDVAVSPTGLTAQVDQGYTFEAHSWLTQDEVTCGYLPFENQESATFRFSSPTTAVPPRSDDYFQTLAQREPEVLLSLLPSLSTVELSFAAEAVGLIGIEEVVRQALLPLLRDSSRLVREGAIYGAVPVLQRSSGLREVIRDLAIHDPSPGVRLAAESALEA